MEKLKSIIQKEDIDKAIDYETYRNMMTKWVAEGKTSGSKQSEALAEYTKMNYQRMKRWEKTYIPSEDFKAKIKTVEKKLYWVILTEAWCGDAAQNISTIEKMASLNDNIQTVYLFRDENLEIMDSYLTNGGRSIPKLICLEQKTLEEMFTWGPRPKPAQELVKLYKDNPEVDYKLEVHTWYAKDKGRTIEKEFIDLMERCSVEVAS